MREGVIIWGSAVLVILAWLTSIAAAGLLIGIHR